MALVHTAAARNAATNAVVDLLDIGAGTNGTLEILTSADVVLATFTLDATAFGASAAGVATMGGLPKTVAAGATGTAAKYFIKDQDGTEVWRGTVTATGGGGDATIDNVSIVSGQNVTVNTFTYTALPA